MPMQQNWKINGSKKHYSELKTAKSIYLQSFYCWHSCQINLESVINHALIGILQVQVKKKTFKNEINSN